MTEKHYKIQSQKFYWFETLSLFTDECLTKEEMEQYKHELSQRLADLVKNNSVIKCGHKFVRTGDSFDLTVYCSKCGKEG